MTNLQDRVTSGDVRSKVVLWLQRMLLLFIDEGWFKLSGSLNNKQMVCFQIDSSHLALKKSVLL